MKKLFWKIAPGALALGLDQATKAAARAALMKEGRVVVLPGLLALRYAENTGAAFSLLAQSPGLIMALTGCLLLAAAVWMARDKQMSALCAAGLSLIIGGGLGNLIDRAIFGYVTDFIEALFVRFAIFNAADCAVCLGAALCAVSLGWRDRK